MTEELSKHEKKAAMTFIFLILLKYNCKDHMISRDFHMS